MTALLTRPAMSDAQPLTVDGPRRTSSAGSCGRAATGIDGDVWAGDESGPACTAATNGSTLQQRGDRANVDLETRPSVLYPPPAFGAFSVANAAPPVSIYHDAQAYYVMMLLPGVESARCWTQVYSSGVVEVAYSLHSHDSLWAESEALRLRYKQCLVSYMPDCIPPKGLRTLGLPFSGAAEGAAAGDDAAAHVQCVRLQLPVAEHGRVAWTMGGSVGKRPRTSVRLGVYKAKIYKLRAGEDG